MPEDITGNTPRSISREEFIMQMSTGAQNALARFNAHRLAMETELNTLMHINNNLLQLMQADLNEQSPEASTAAFDESASEADTANAH